MIFAIMIMTFQMANIKISQKLLLRLVFISIFSVSIMTICFLGILSCSSFLKGNIIAQIEYKFIRSIIWYIFWILVLVGMLPLVCKITTGFRNKLKKGIIGICYGMTFLTGGVINALENSRLFYIRGIKGTILGLALTEIIVQIISYAKRQQKNIYQVELWQKGVCYRGEALYDTGNRLIDPYRGRMIHIVSEIICQKLKPLEPPLIVPYRALGTVNGLLEVYEIDSMIIIDKGKKNILEKPLLGIAEGKLMTGKSYEIILNEGVI